MATEIKLRRGTTSQHTSFNGAEGEVTFDTDKHTLIVHNNEGNGTGRQVALLSDVQAVDTLAEILALSNTTGGNNIVFGDSGGATDDRLVFGSGTDGNGDLHIFHNGSHSIINHRHEATGSLFIIASNEMHLQMSNASAGTETAIKMVEDGAVQLFFDNTAGGSNTTYKLATTASGIDVTGEVKGDTLDIDGNASIAGAVTDVTTLTASGELEGGSLDINGNADISGNLVLGGNLNVTGTTTTVNQTNLDVSDNIIGLNRGAGSNSNDSGFIIERGSTGDNAIFAWDESADKFTLGTTTATPSSTGNLSITPGTLVANVEGNVTGNVSGTALTVTQAAQTAITSVGTLTGLSVNTSNAEASINVGTDFLKITCSDTDSGVLIENASGDSNQPDLILRRTTASSNISDGEGIGNILFDAKNANEDNENYSAIVARVDDKTTGSEDGSLDFNIKVNGSFVKRIELDSVGSTFIGDVVVDTGSVKLKNASNKVTTISENAGGNITLTLPSATGTIALTSEIPTVPASGISNGDVATFTSGVVDDDFLRVSGTSIEGLSNTELKSALSLAKADVGLGNLDNTTDANKPVSTATQSALNLKANIASPTFTGTVAGITSTMVGLGNVENKSSATIRGEIVSGNIPTLNQDTTGNAATATIAKGAAVIYDASNDGAIGHAVVAGFVGKTVVYTNTVNGDDLTLGVPQCPEDVAIGEQIHLVNASTGSGSTALIIFNLGESSDAQNINICTGASVADVGTTNPHIIAGGVATLVAVAANEYILFGSGVVDNS